MSQPATVFWPDGSPLVNPDVEFSFLQLFTLPMCPESPKHLLLDRDDEGRAETALKWLRGKVDVRGELGEMRCGRGSCSNTLSMFYKGQAIRDKIID